MERRACALLGLVCLIASTISLGEAQQQQQQSKGDTEKYQGVDLDRILHNNRLLTTYIKCMLDKGSCTPEGRELKKTFPDAIKSGCEKCSKKQKDTANRVINHLMVNRPKEWQELIQKYDPSGEFQKRFEAQGKKL